MYAVEEGEGCGHEQGDQEDQEQEEEGEERCRETETYRDSGSRGVSDLVRFAEWLPNMVCDCDRPSCSSGNQLTTDLERERERVEHGCRTSGATWSSKLV